MSPIKILIFGATGMLGHTLFYRLSKEPNLDVYGTIRNQVHPFSQYYPDLADKLLQNIKVEDWESITNCLAEIKPRVAINCVGIIKQLPQAYDGVKTITINALFPHRLALTCGQMGIRLIHISTDCVFSGNKGNYDETDLPDPIDLYGRTKLLGEVTYPNCLTLRTSIIGHELDNRHGLVEWFLAQNGRVKGYTQAVFSGLPTVELAEIFRKHLLGNTDLQGLYQVSADPISKYQLLELIAKIYQRKIEIEPDGYIRVDRSLNSKHFRELTGYSPPTWPELIQKMHQDFITARHYQPKKIGS